MVQNAKILIKGIYSIWRVQIIAPIQTERHSFPKPAT